MNVKTWVYMCGKMSDLFNIRHRESFKIQMVARKFKKTTKRN